MKLVMLIGTSGFFFAMIFKILIESERDYFGNAHILDAINNNDAVGFFENAYGL